MIENTMKNHEQNIKQPWKTMNKTLNNNEKHMKTWKNNTKNKHETTREKKTWKQHETKNMKHHEQKPMKHHEKKQWTIFRLTDQNGESTFPVTRVSVTNPPRYSGLYGLVEKLLPEMQKVTRQLPVFLGDDTRDEKKIPGSLPFHELSWLFK